MVWHVVNHYPFHTDQAHYACIFRSIYSSIFNLESLLTGSLFSEDAREIVSDFKQYAEHTLACVELFENTVSCEGSDRLLIKILI